MTTTKNRFARVRQLFDQALDRTPDTRPGFLAEACGDDGELKREVESLLAAVGETHDQFLDPPTPDAFSGLLEDRSLSMVGRRVGHYEINRVIGFGGMGAVYEAHRADDQYRKRVAIKLVKRGLETDHAVRRFRYERQILAKLDHRNIAGLVDGGVTEDGRPYFVLEYVEGIPITHYCNQHQLGIQERLQLFRQVCAAVQFAHQNLVVHRDLKPGNILVATDGTVKLLDFGIAKFMGEDESTEAAPLTRGGVRALTPEYASPEMIKGESISVAADVYSLGVILFELLAGRRPFRFEDQTLAGLERAVCDRPAPPPSQVVTEQQSAAVRKPADALKGELAGELDSIVLMALRKEPARRYPSAEAFGLDLRRYLTGLPVTAQRDWLGYRIEKFVGRNRIPVAIGGLLIASLVGGIILTTAQARRADRERKKAEQVTNFLTGMLAAPEPTVQRRDVTVAELLDSAAIKARRELGRDPDVQGVVQSTLGHTYLGIGRYAEAETAFRTALESYRQGGAEPAEIVVAMNNVASALMNGSRFPAADSLFREAVAYHDRARLGRDSTLAVLYDNLGSLTQQQGQPDSSEYYHRASLEIRESYLHGDDETLARSMSNLAVALGMRGKYAPAESLERRAAAMMIRIHGENHSAVAAVLSALAGLLDFTGKPGADSLYLRVLAIRKKVLGAEHPDYAWTLFNYSAWLIDHKRYQEAAAISHEVLALKGKTLTEAHPAIGASYLNLGKAELGLGRFHEAEAAIRESIRVRSASLPEGHWVIASSQVALGEVYLAQGKTQEAEPIFRAGYARLETTVGPDHPRTKDTARLLHQVYLALGKPDLAAQFAR